MVLFLLDSPPQRLRGLLSRYCLEIRAGTFIGQVDARVRDALWFKIKQLATPNTRAVLAYTTNNAQGFAFEVLGTDDRQPVLVDGLWLVEHTTSRST